MKFVFAHFLGNYSWAWDLIAGSRENKFKNGIPADVDELAAAMRKIYGEAYKAFTGKDDQEISGIVDWERAARQVIYFMTDSYIEGMKNRNIPEGIYEPLSRVSYDPHLETSVGWTENGWMYDGVNRDLGPFNGPNPIQELIKINYIYTIFMISSPRNPGFDGGNKPGGIDFRFMPAGRVSAPIKDFMVKYAPESGVFDRDKEYALIKDLVNAGKSPSGLQLCRYAAACHSGEFAQLDKDGIHGVVCEVLRLQEDLNIQADADIKELLSFIETP